MVGTRSDEATGINLEHLCRSIPAAEQDGRAQCCCVTWVWLVVFTADLYFHLPRAQYCMVVFTTDLYFHLPRAQYCMAVFSTDLSFTYRGRAQYCMVAFTTDLSFTYRGRSTV